MSDALTLEQVEKQRDDARVVIVRLSAENAALRAQVAAQRDILTSLVKVVGHMKVPQTIADAALQLLIVGPVLKRAQDFLEKEAQG